MNLRQLEVFEALMQSRSVSGAARLLSLTQPAVTKSLRLAEQSAGFLLFRRVRGRLYPSPEAETLWPQVERVRSDLGAVSLLLRQLRDGNAGSVTVAAVGGVAHSFVTPAIVRFARMHPKIRVESMILPTSSVVERVAQSQADFGLVHEPVDNPYIDGEPICQVEAVCLMLRRHPLAKRRVLAVRDLEGVPLVSFREDTAIGRLVRKAIADARLRREVDFVVNQGQQAVALAEQGAGIAIIDPFLLIGHPRRGLTAVPFRPAIPLRLRVIRARERPRSRAAAGLEREIRLTIANLTQGSRFAIRELVRER